MTIAVDAFWIRLQTVLSSFAAGLVAADPTLVPDIARTANDAFLLRGYLALRRHADGNEVAITVDVRSDGQQLTLDSDVCTDGGEVVATGPSTRIPIAEGRINVEIGIRDWLIEFERFLGENEQKVAAVASTLA